MAVMPHLPCPGLQGLQRALHLPQPWLLSALCRSSAGAAAAICCPESTVKQRATG